MVRSIVSGATHPSVMALLCHDWACPNIMWQMNVRVIQYISIGIIYARYLTSTMKNNKPLD